MEQTTDQQDGLQREEEARFTSVSNPRRVRL